MDIFKITKSKTRSKILELYFFDPAKKYYLRELERIIGFPVGNIRRELIPLEKSGLFQKEKQGKEVYYFLNKKAVLFEELKKIISKTIGMEEQLRKELKKIRGIKKAFIFGSFAKNKEKSGSDIDLMIIGTVDENPLISKISRLESRTGREINYHLFDEAEWSKKSKTDSFLKAVESGPKIKLI